MAKQKKVEVDEDVVQRMVTGDIPRLKVEEAVRRAEVKPEPASESESEPVADLAGESSAPEAEPHPDNQASKPRRKREPKDYAANFLKKREAAPKRQTYIGMTLFVKLTDILAVVAPDTSIPTFLDNVLTHHLELFRDEINELYTDKFKKPL